MIFLVSNDSLSFLSETLNGFIGCSSGYQIHAKDFSLETKNVAAGCSSAASTVDHVTTSRLRNTSGNQSCLLPVAYNVCHNLPFTPRSGALPILVGICSSRQLQLTHFSSLAAPFFVSHNT